MPEPREKSEVQRLREVIELLNHALDACYKALENAELEERNTHNSTGGPHAH